MNAVTLPTGAELRPTVCLAHEPEESRALRWIPLAVRYKLDKSLLHISLDTWHMLPLDVRESLVSEPLEGGAFDELAVCAGACVMRADRDTPPTFAEYVMRKLPAREAAAATATP